MDVVVVTRAADAHLLRFFLASYKCFWEGGGSLILFTRRIDGNLLSKLDLPPRTRLVYREDYPELGHDDFRNQLYLKLISHKLVETENYVIMDSDFLLLAPCTASMFFHRGRPIWFSRDWDEIATRWRAGSESFVGASIDRQYMSAPQYVISRPIATELARRYDLGRILEMSGVSEYVVYGWFASTFFPGSYHWIDLQADHVTPVNRADVAPIGRKVNQVPPSYCMLNPEVSLDDFPEARYVAFWSHWDLAEKKMAEFLLEAQRRNPDRPSFFPKTDRIYPMITPPAPLETLYADMRGLHQDGWVKDEIWFAINPPSSISRLTLQFEIPSGPIRGSWQFSGGPQNCFQLGAGSQPVRIPLGQEGSPYEVLLRFNEPEIPVVESTGRVLRARLTGVSLDL